MIFDVKTIKRSFKMGVIEKLQEKKGELEIQLEAARERVAKELDQAGEKVLAGQDPDQASQAVAEARARRDTILTALQGAEQRLERARKEEREQLRAEGQKSIDRLERQARKLRGDFFEALDRAYQLQGEIKELKSEAYGIANQTGADPFKMFSSHEQLRLTLWKIRDNWGGE
jgi:chromosome segregation ATPase